MQGIERSSDHHVSDFQQYPRANSDLKIMATDGKDEMNVWKMQQLKSVGDGKKRRAERMMEN